MTSNYWSSKLGFDSEDNLLPAATANETPPPSCCSGALVVSEEESLENWMLQFQERMQTKEQDKIRRLNEQLNRDDEEMEKWKAIREHDEKIVRERQLAIAREEALALAQKERDAAADAERRRIQQATEGMTPEERQRWIEDEQELEALEKTAHAREVRLASLNAILQIGASEYEAKIAAEVEALAQEAARFSALQEEQRQELRKDVDVFFATEAAVREAISCEEPETLATLVQELTSQAEIIRAKERLQVLSSCNAESLTLIEAVRSDAEREALLDELVLLRNMQMTLRVLQRQ